MIKLFSWSYIKYVVVIDFFKRKYYFVIHFTLPQKRKVIVTKKKYNFLQFYYLLIRD